MCGLSCRRAGVDRNDICYDYHAHMATATATDKGYQNIARAWVLMHHDEPPFRYIRLVWRRETCAEK